MLPRRRRPQQHTGRQAYKHKHALRAWGGAGAWFARVTCSDSPKCFRSAFCTCTAAPCSLCTREGRGGGSRHEWGIVWAPSGCSRAAAA